MKMSGFKRVSGPPPYEASVETSSELPSAAPRPQVDVHRRFFVDDHIHRYGMGGKMNQTVPSKSMTSLNLFIWNWRQ